MVIYFCAVMKFQLDEPSFLLVFWLKEKNEYMFKCLLCNGENTCVYNGTCSGVDLLLLDSVFYSICLANQNGMMPWHKYIFLNTLLQLYRFIMAVCDVN